MDDVVVGEGAVFTVFEPFLRGLISANEKVPGNLRDIVEILSGVDEDSSGRSTQARCLFYFGDGRDIRGTQAGRLCYYIAGRDAHAPDYFFDDIASGDGIVCNWSVEFGGFHQMEFAKFATFLDKLPELFGVFRQGNAREVNLQKFLVFLSVVRGMKNSVNVVEKVLGGKVGWTFLSVI